MDLETHRSLSIKRKKNGQNGGMKHSVSAFGFSTETSCFETSHRDSQMSPSPTLYIDELNEGSKDHENWETKFEEKDSVEHLLSSQGDAKR